MRRWRVRTAHINHRLHEVGLSLQQDLVRLLRRRCINVGSLGVQLPINPDTLEIPGRWCLRVLADDLNLTKGEYCSESEDPTKKRHTDRRRKTVAVVKRPQPKANDQNCYARAQ